MVDVQTSEQPAAQRISRRNFYIGAIYAIWGVIAAALGLPAATYLFLPPKVRQENHWVEIGDVNTLAVNSPVEITFRRNRVDGWKILSEKTTTWVVKQADNQIVAFGPQCTHLGCAYHWEDRKNQFLCPCHASLFGIDGKVAAGPAPRSLDRFDVKVEGSKLLVGDLRQPESNS